MFDRCEVDIQTQIISLLLFHPSRHAYYAAHNKSNTSQWAKAKTILLKSNTKVVVTQTGVNKGNVRGLPKDIDANIQQVLIRIINGEEDIHLPDYG